MEVSLHLPTYRRVLVRNLTPALLQRSEQLSGRSDFESDDDERLQKERRSNFLVVCSLNELLSCAAGYRKVQNESATRAKNETCLGMCRDFDKRLT